MSQWLDEVGAYLAGLGLGEVGTSIQKERMKDTPDVCLCVYETPGRAPELQFGTNRIQVEKPNGSVHVRGAASKLQEPHARCLAVRDALAKLCPGNLGGTVYRWVQILSGPFKLREDEKGRTIYVVNFAVDREVP